MKQKSLTQKGRGYQIKHIVIGAYETNSRLLFIN